jgi:hypothetical protein
MTDNRRQLISPTSKAAVLAVLGLAALPYLLMLAAIGEYHLLGTQSLVDCYRSIGIAEFLDWYGSNTLGRLAGG